MAHTIYLIRHGQTDFNLQHRFQGQQDIPLNDTGRGEARRNGLRLKELLGDAQGFDFIASPMIRARETMEIARAAMDLPATEYRTDPRLIEVHFGDWHGHTYKELEAVDPGIYARRQLAKWTFVPPGEGAESYQMLLERIEPWFRAISQPTVCVAHGGTLKAAMVMTKAMEPQEAAGFIVPQDRILRLEGNRVEWL